LRAPSDVPGGIRPPLPHPGDRAASAHCGSDRDKAPEETRAKGERGVEILKRGRYEPMAQEDQVLQIYAATNRDDEKKRGWIRDVPTPDVQRWAKEFIEYVHSKSPQIPQEIREKKELSNELKGRINKALTEFNGLFQPTPHKG